MIAGVVMKTFKKIVNWLRNSKGVATSLVEATATVAVGGVLASVAVGSAIDVINNAKVQAAGGDVITIGQAVTAFYSDNNFFPLFVDGNKTGPADTFFGFLVSENGNFPTDQTTGNIDTWSVVTGETTAWNGANPTGTTLSAFGTKPDYGPGTTGIGADSIEGQLMRNILGNLQASTARYPAYNAQTGRGAKNPYIANLPQTDPWGDKYIINIRNANAGYLTQQSVKTAYASCITSGSGVPSLAVFVISAGPDRVLSTPVNQCASNTRVLGDDIIYRIE
jgi:type II secretory pathway pseudopilin PulG